MDKAKRFYTHVTLHQEANLFQLQLDGRPVKNADIILQHSSEPLMRSIKGEWEAQRDVITMDSMPYTRILFSLLLMQNETRAHLLTTLNEYASGDTLFYHADEGSALAEEQMLLWSRWINWAESYFDIALHVTHNIMPLDQPEASLKTIKHRLTQQSDIAILSLFLVTDTLKSFIVALALLEGKLDADDAMQVAWLEHDAQAKQWGEDAEATHKRKTALEFTRTVSQFYNWVK